MITFAYYWEPYLTGKEKMKFSEEFESRRKDKDLTYRALAEKLNLQNHGILVQYGKGSKFPRSGKIISRISSALDWDEKLIYLAIQQEKAPSSAKKYFDPSQAAYPSLRKLLLKYYSKDLTKEKLVRDEFISLEEMGKILLQYPIHPIEKLLFHAVYNELITLNKIPGDPSRIDPIDYFNKLTENARKQIIEETKLHWAYSRLHNVVACKFGNSDLKWTLVPWFTLGAIETIREVLLRLYVSPEKGFATIGEINKIIRSDSSYRIESKLFEELNKRLPAQSRTTSFEDFSLRSKEGIREIIEQSGLMMWTYKTKDSSLYMTFNDNKTIAFKLFWQKIK